MSKTPALSDIGLGDILPCAAGGYCEHEARRTGGYEVRLVNRNLGFADPGPALVIGPGPLQILLDSIG